MQTWEINIREILIACKKVIKRDQIINSMCRWATSHASALSPSFVCHRKSSDKRKRQKQKEGKAYGQKEWKLKKLIIYTVIRFKNHEQIYLHSAKMYEMIPNYSYKD